METIKPINIKEEYDKLFPYKEPGSYNERQLQALADFARRVAKMQRAKCADECFSFYGFKLLGERVELVANDFTEITIISD